VLHVVWIADGFSGLAAILYYLTYCFTSTYSISRRFCEYTAACTCIILEYSSLLIAGPILAVSSTAKVTSIGPQIPPLLD
jgi:hypothetical protein